MTYLNEQKHINLVGINCTSPEYISKLIENIKSVCSKPIVIYPNGGSKYNPVKKLWTKGEIKPKEFAKLAHYWYNKGAKLLGGCCQTGPEEIKYMKELLVN